MIRHEKKGVLDCRGEGGIRFLQKLLLLQEELERKNANGGGRRMTRKEKRIRWEKGMGLGASGGRGIYR